MARRGSWGRRRLEKPRPFTLRVGWAPRAHALLSTPKMSHYRRAIVPGGTFFFTAVTYQRAPWLVQPSSRVALKEAIARCRTTRPFEVNAWVLLPDHLHTVWTLPANDHDFSTRWAQIKRTVSVLLADQKQADLMVESKSKHRESTLWQRRFFEHAIRDDADYARCIDYVHHNPVKHGLVKRTADWPWSTFHRYVAEGRYAANWGDPASQ